MSEENIQTAYTRSIELLKHLAHEHGFFASLEDIANYKRIWSRDGIIAGLASLSSGDDALIATHRATCNTLRDHQDKTGRIPSNVTANGDRVSYGTTVGRVDATIWYIIGVCQYALRTNDFDFFNTHRDAVARALFYLECLELNGRGLLYIPEGGDWADEYVNQGYVLFDELLYYRALRDAARALDRDDLHKKADHLRRLIVVNYFPAKENLDDPDVYNQKLFARTVDSYRPPLPLAHFTTNNTLDQIDTFASALLLLSDVIEDEHKQAIAHTLISQCSNVEFSILPAFYPVITEKDHEWVHLENNFAYQFKNEPYEYHNGGLWPLVHGFFIASIKDTDAQARLEAFAAILARDGYIFPEYYHGQTHEAKGTKELGFSASAYIIAYNAIKNNDPIFV